MIQTVTQTTVPFGVDPLTTAVYVAGHNGMVGSGISRRIANKGYRSVFPEKRVDLTDQKATLDLVERLQPDWIFDAAARVGGIAANSNYPAQFIYENLAKDI
jgi:GDP-L-fucose synthase